MKKIKTVIQVLVLIMSLVMLSACGPDENEIPFVVAYEGRGSFGYEYASDLYPDLFPDPTPDPLPPWSVPDYEVSVYVPVTMVSSVEELKELCTKYKNPAFDEDNKDYSNDYYKKIRGYDEGYFTDRVVIFVDTATGNGSDTFKVKNVTIDGAMLAVNISHITYSELFFGISYDWHFQIEIKKADIEGVTDVKFEIITKMKRR